MMTAAAEKRARRKEGSCSIRPDIDLYVLSAIKTATPTLGFSAINDAATTQQEINLKKTQIH